jgi:hypothetical protein
MNRLGYTEFVAQGGDWGTRHRAGGSVEASGLLGIHTNMPLTVPADISKAIQIDDPPPSGLSADDEKAYEVVVHFFKTAVGYANEMANRPQTHYGIADSGRLGRLDARSRCSQLRAHPAFFDVKGAQGRRRRPLRHLGQHKTS